MNKSASFYKGLNFMLVSAAGMSLVGLFGKMGIAELTVSAIMFWRYVASWILFFLPLLLFNRLKGFFRFHQIGIQTLRAAFVLTAQYCFFYYLKRDNLLNAAALLNTGPLFISLIEWGILRKKVGLSSWIAAPVSFLGALLILRPDRAIFSWVSLIGLGSGVFQGASQVVFGLQSKKAEDSNLSVLHLFTLCTLFSFIPYLLFDTAGLGANDFNNWDFLIIFLIGAASVANQIFRSYAYQHSTPSRLSPFLYFSVFLAGVWDWAVFGILPTWMTILGAGLIVSGGLLKIYLRKVILKKKGEL